VGASPQLVTHWVDAKHSGKQPPPAVPPLPPLAPDPLEPPEPLPAAPPLAAGADPEPELHAVIKPKPKTTRAEAKASRMPAIVARLVPRADCKTPREMAPALAQPVPRVAGYDAAMRLGIVAIVSVLASIGACKSAPAGEQREGPKPSAEPVTAEPVPPPAAPQQPTPAGPTPRCAVQDCKTHQIIDDGCVDDGKGGRICASCVNPCP
jgi:hypothetical protein